MHNCCNNYTRSQLLRSAAAEAGKGLPAIEPGMPEPGRDRALAAQLPLPERRASRSPSTAPRRSRSRPSRTGSRRRRRATRSSSRSSSTAASTRSACSPRSATRATRSCGRTSRSRPKRGPNSPRTPACAGTRRPQRWRPCTARARSAPSRRSATTIPTSRTSPRATTTRSASSRSASSTGWLGRYIDLVGDDDNPLQGLSMDGSLSPMIATADKPVAAIDSVDGYDLWSAGQRPGLRRDVQQLRPLRLAAGRLARPRRRCAGRRPRPTSCARTSAGSAASPARSTYPDNGLLPQARRPRRLHRRRPADAGGDDPRRGRLRHPRRPGR